MPCRTSFTCAHDKDLVPCLEARVLKHAAYIAGPCNNAPCRTARVPVYTSAP